MITDSPVRAVLLFAVPVAIGSLFQSLYNTMDSIIIGRFLGARALAAVGSAAQITGFFLMISIALTTAFSVMTAQYFGARNNEMVRRTAVGCIYIVAAGSAVIGAAGAAFARPIMTMMQADALIIDDAVLYMRICVGLCFGQVAYNATASILRAIGDSRTPLYFLILSSILNVVLNITFVAVFGMGVAGVAIATVIAQVASAAACIWYTWKKYPIFHFTGQDLKPDWKLIWDTLKLGLSLSVQLFVTSLGDVVISARINSFGVVTVTAYTAVSQIMRFATMLFSSISNGFSVFAGQNFGAGLYDRVKSGFKKVAVISVLTAAAGAAVMLLFGTAFIRAFLSEADPHFAQVLVQARQYQIISGVCYPFLALVWMYNQTLRGMGEALVPMAAGITEIVFKLAGALVLSSVIGVTGLWLASPVGWIFGIIPGALYYHSGKWIQKKRIRQSA